MDRVADFFAQRTPRRFVALLAFGSIVYLFRHLAILLVFFVTFERALGWSARTVSARFGIPRKKCVLIVLGIALALFGLLLWLGIGKTVRTFTAMQETFPERLAQLREHPLVDRLEDQIGGMDKVLEGVKHYSGSALSAAKAIGHFVVHIVMGFVLALVYVLEQDEIDAFWARVDRRSLAGTLARWCGHVADATIVTVQLQLIVAACNTALTLPVLLLIGVPNVGALMILIFVSALVPVIGNIVSGVTLSLLAYQQKGWFGVGLFVGLTFILHKIESYYLNPRLTSRHVRLPGFLLIVSLIACEHVFGFTGLFLSFPILFVAGRIRGDFVEEDRPMAASPSRVVDEPAELPSKRRSLPPSTDEEPSGMELETARIPLDTIRPRANTTESARPPSQPLKASPAPQPLETETTPAATPAALKSSRAPSEPKVLASPDDPASE
jgi:predicted PurR-regulated permease PerM